MPTQVEPARVVRGSEGTLYLIRGSYALTLVPGEISDAEANALTLYGQIDATLPNQAPSARRSVLLEDDTRCYRRAHATVAVSSDVR
jgi:hypothetical protein